MTNSPEVRLGVIGVSRDCFPIELTRTRLKALMAALKKQGIAATACSVIIENEIDMLEAQAEMATKDINCAVMYLGNFGPEGPTTMFAEQFGGPVMFCAAAEEKKVNLKGDRGDAYCGMLNASYNLQLRSVPAYIPQMPVGTAPELAEKIGEFEDIARVLLGLQSLKVLSFGPRPQDFLACNAPIQPLYDLGIEVMENSELDLLALYQSVKGRKKEINAIASDMKKELGKGCSYPDLLPKLAQYELALLTFMEENLGASDYAVFANKCWPAFEGQFGFVPCFINSRLAGRGIPVACEVDIYGAVSEYMCQLATQFPATLLDINNTVPADMIGKKDNLKGASAQDLFMGFHCGNTPSCCMKNCSLKYQLIMNRLMEDGKEPDITRGTLEGAIMPGATTIFRLQSSPDCYLKSYVAEGHVLAKDPASFGAIGIFAIPGMARFYRHVLIEGGFPHHSAIAFKHVGKVLYEVVKYLGIDDIGTPLPATLPYPGENPFELF
ncbi:MAG: L-fucose/L-arabinose isomerase family protein [Planctomycetota bacterium]